MFKEESSRWPISTMEQLGEGAGNLALSFLLNFLCTFKAPPIIRSLWTRHHWKDLFLLRKLSIDDANSGQKWWHQEWKKGQGSLRTVTGGTGVNGLNNTTSSPGYLGQWFNNLHFWRHFDAISSIICSGLHFWCYRLNMTRFFTKLVNSGWLWWIMHVILTNQKQGNILNE